MQISYSGSMMRAYIVQHQAEIEAWAGKQPVNPSNETASIGGVTLMRRVWDNVVHVSPAYQIDEWMLHRWENGFVDAANADELRERL